MTARQRIAAFAAVVAIVVAGAVLDDGVWNDVPEPSGSPVPTAAPTSPATVEIDPSVPSTGFPGNGPVVPSAPAVRITTTSTPPATQATTTTVMPAASALCPQWWDEARSVGWSDDQLPTLDFLMHREARCDPSQRSTTHDTGLLQLNDVHLSWLAEYGISQADLYDPATNLRAALLLFETAVRWYGCGWQPWTTGSWSPC